MDCWEKGAKNTKFFKEGRLLSFMKRGIFLGLLLISAIILISVGVIAYGVSSPYWKSNPLKMYAGQTKEVGFTLFNNLGEQKDADVIVSVVKGGEIARVGQNNYRIPFGTTGTKLLLSVSIPENVEVGKNYDVKLSINPAFEEGAGSVELGVNYAIEFPVMVVEKASAVENSPRSNVKIGANAVIGIFVIVAFVIFIGVYLMLKRRGE